MTQHFGSDDRFIDDNSTSSNQIAYKQGCIAASNKKKVGDNPHDEYRGEHWSWMKGFTDTLSKLKN